MVSLNCPQVFRPLWDVVMLQISKQECLILDRLDTGFYKYGEAPLFVRYLINCVIPIWLFYSEKKFHYCISEYVSLFLSKYAKQPT